MKSFYPHTTGKSNRSIDTDGLYSNLTFSATDFRDELIHGFILVFSTRRRASLSTLTAFSLNIPELPIQLLAISDDNNYAHDQNDLNAQLITEGNNLADRLNAHFMTSSASIQQKTSFYTPFFKEVFEKKSEIEQAFQMEDAARLDDSGEGTLERPMRHQPMPPPRIDSYRLMHPHGRGSGSRSGSGSEIYERLPADSGSLGDDLEDRLRISDSEGESDGGHHPNIYSNLEQQRSSNGQEEHLVKPSQLKHNKNKPKPPSRPRPNHQPQGKTRSDYLISTLLTQLQLVIGFPVNVI